MFVQFSHLSHHSDIKQQIGIINSCKSTDQQLKEIKKLSESAKPTNAWKQNAEIVDLLVKIFFKEQIKHPVKSTIQRFVKKPKISTFE